ncbi:UbiA family prenyltransferase [Kistimonas asteriae]|uniref:UbiA family prenyltransferase n=1 Tax=Kistimonas asteriae TaxID=517724 RepID=UPI001BA89B29|nr:UbiA family prenyltransferase [Kistimonas asteriae]
MSGSTLLIATPPKTTFADATQTLASEAVDFNCYLDKKDTVAAKAPEIPLCRRCINRFIAIIAVISTLLCALVAAPVVGLCGGLVAIGIVASGMPIAPVSGPGAGALGILVIVIFSAGALTGIGFTFFYTPYCMTWVYDTVMKKLESDYQSPCFVQRILKAYDGEKANKPVSSEKQLLDEVDATKSPEYVTMPAKNLTASDEMPVGNKKENRDSKY